MNRKPLQKLVAIVLSLIMVLGMMPLSAIAETVTAQEDAAITVPDVESESIENTENKTEEQPIVMGTTVEEHIAEEIPENVVEEIIEDVVDEIIVEEAIEEILPEEIVEEIVEDVADEIIVEYLIEDIVEDVVDEIIVEEVIVEEAVEELLPEEIVVEEPVEEVLPEEIVDVVDDVTEKIIEEVTEEEPVQETSPETAVPAVALSAVPEASEEDIESSEEIPGEDAEEEAIKEGNEEVASEENAEEEASEEEILVIDPENQPLSLTETLTTAPIAAMMAMARAAGWDPANGSYDIGSVSDLEAFRNYVNSGNSLSGALVNLLADLDLSSISDWTPIGNGSMSGSGFTGNPFAGTFNGQGHTISNLTITGRSGNQTAGLFGVVNGGTIQNLVLDKVNINVPNDNLAASAVSLLTGGGTAENITVKSGSVKGGNGAGGVVGIMSVSGTIKDCTNNASVTGNNIGGIVGAADYATAGKTMTVANCTNTGTVTGTGGVGGVIGRSSAEISGSKNSGAVNVPVGGAAYTVGGIAGQQGDAGYIKDCTNSGTVQNNDSSVSGKNGGIVGMVWYPKLSSRAERIELSGNTNTGDVIGGHFVGGIAGSIDGTAIVTDNGVSSKNISGDYETAGVIGYYNNNGSFAAGCTLVLTGNDVATDINNITSVKGTASSYTNIKNPPASGSDIQTTNPPHKFGSWKITVPPQVGVPGTQERECTTCGAKETATVPALTEEVKTGKADVKVTLPYVINALWIHDGMPEADDIGINHLYAPAVSWGIAVGLLTEEQVDKMTTYGDLRLVLTAYAALHGVEDMVIDLPGADDEEIANAATLNKILEQFYMDLEEALAAKAA